MTGFREYALACTRDFDATARSRDEFVHPLKLAVGVLRERAPCGRSRLACTRAAVKKDIMRPVCLQSCGIESTARVTYPAIPYISRYTPAYSWRHVPLSATHRSRAYEIMRTGHECAPAAMSPCTHPGKVCSHPKTEAWRVPVALELPHAPGLALRIHTNSELVCCVDRDPVAKTAGCVPGTHPSNSQSIPATCSYALLNQCPMSHTQGILAFRATHPTVLGDGPLFLQHTRSNLARSRETGPGVQPRHTAPVTHQHQARKPA